MWRTYQPEIYAQYARMATFLEYVPWGKEEKKKGTTGDMMLSVCLVCLCWICLTCSHRAVIDRHEFRTSMLAEDTARAKQNLQTTTELKERLVESWRQMQWLDEVFQWGRKGENAGISIEVPHPSCRLGEHIQNLVRAFFSFS